jgi:hypothetical protein
MALFNDLLGIGNTSSEVKELGEKKDVSGTAQGEQESVPVGESIARVKRSELRDCYITDAIVFNSINKNTQTIMGAGHELRCDGKYSKHVLNFFNDFLNINLGVSGNDETWEDMLNSHFTNAQVYGYNYIERIYNQEGTKIVDLITLNPERMDYARTGEGGICLDSYGKPVGYTQQLPMGTDISNKGDPVPDGVSLKTSMIFLLPKRIAQFKFYPIGDGYEAFGLIEPAHDDIIYKKNIEKANANVIVQRGLNPLIDYVGSPERFPTPKMIDNATKTLADMSYKRYFAFPYWHRIEALDFKQNDTIEQSIKNYRENISASLGIPLALATGAGEATNRATLTNQQKFLEFTLNDIVKRTISFFTKQIFREISRLEKFKEVPYLVWGDIGAENKDDKANRLVAYAKANLLPPEFVIQYIVNSEELDVTEEDLENAKKPKTIPKKAPNQVPLEDNKTFK